MKPLVRSVLSIALTGACLFIGYAMYRLNHSRDPVVWVCLTFGLSGILLSVLRKQKGNPS